jgi:hypothetical protein
MSLAINLGIVLGIGLFRPEPTASDERVMDVALVPQALLDAIPDPVPPPSQRTSPTFDRSTASASSGGQPPAVSAQPSPTPSGSATEGDEIDPSDYALGPGVVPAGLRPYVNADPCQNPDIRLRPARCRSEWREATNAVDERQAREDRALRVRAMERELGVRHCSGNSISYQLGILNPGSSATGCGVQGDLYAPGETPDAVTLGLPGMDPGGPSGGGDRRVAVVPLDRPAPPARNACPDGTVRGLRNMPTLDLVRGADSVLVS